jgi:hypothetical protein
MSPRDFPSGGGPGTDLRTTEETLPYDTRPIDSSVREAAQANAVNAVRVGPPGSEPPEREREDSGVALTGLRHSARLAARMRSTRSDLS